jgi:general stress protein 26
MPKIQSQAANPGGAWTQKTFFTPVVVIRKSGLLQARPQNLYLRTKRLWTTNRFFASKNSEKVKEVKQQNRFAILLVKK